MAYHERYIEKLKTFSAIDGRDVAVLGCSFGRECELFIKEGANSVVGFDTDHKIGQNFKHDAVSYYQRSVSACGFTDETFDIVFSAAVFEHVHDVLGAFKEAVRICRPNGTVMIISSPLWQSPYGNHLVRQLERLPWCHLLFTPNELSRAIQEEHPEIIDEPGAIEEITEKVFDPVYFNRYPPSVYCDSVDHLHGIEVVKNVIWPAQVDEKFKRKYFSKCVDNGFDSLSLMAGAHFFVGQK